jgi:hypothetical protein
VGEGVGKYSIKGFSLHEYVSYVDFKSRSLLDMYSTKVASVAVNLVIIHASYQMEQPDISYLEFAVFKFDRKNPKT